MFVTLVFHHVVPQYRADFTALMRAIESGMDSTPGLLSIESFDNPTNGDLVAIGRWESPEAAQRGVAKLISIGNRQEA